MTDIKTQIDEALIAPEVIPPSDPRHRLNAALRAARDEIERLEVEQSRLDQVEFIHSGCEMIRRKDVEYLLARAEKAEAALARVREAVAPNVIYAPNEDSDGWGAEEDAYMEGADHVLSVIRRALEGDAS